MHNKKMKGRNKSGNKSPDNGSINIDTMKSYLNEIDTSSDPNAKQNMMQRMKANGLEIRGVDNDDDGIPNHAILAMNGPVAGGPSAAAIYDPYARKGGQVIQYVEELDDYYKAVTAETQS